MKKRLLKLAGPAAGLAVLIIALVFLFRELKSYHINEIISRLKVFPAGKITAGFSLTILSYFIMTFYDRLALVYIKRKLPGLKVTFTSLVAYIFSNNIGLSVLSSGAVRFRFYGMLGLSSLEIVKIIAFNAFTFWIGIITASGIMFISEPVSLPSILKFPFESVKPVGFIMISIVAAYLVAAFLYKKSITFKDIEIESPGKCIAIGQVLISTADWMAAGTVFYILLPPGNGISYPFVISIFMLAQTAGLISHVPGGIGVFETVVLMMLSGVVPAADIFTSLLFYRIVYYIIPFVAGILLFIAGEMWIRRPAAGGAVISFGRWLPRVFPSLMAILIFINGVLLLVSAALPNIESRMHRLGMILPINVIEASHFLSALAGTALLFLADRIQKRVDAAYYITLILLVSGAAFMFLGGLNYEEALFLLLSIAAFIPSRKSFKRKTPLLSIGYSQVWGFAVLMVLALFTWTGLFAYKHIEYTHSLWLKFELLNDASRFMRAGIGIASSGILLAVYILTRPVREGIMPPSAEELENAKRITMASENPDGNMVLLGDKYILFSRDSDAFIMYGVQGSSRIVLGDPVGAVDGSTELIWNFCEQCGEDGANPVFFDVSTRFLPVYIELGMSILKIGEKARVKLCEFSIDGYDNRGLRHAYNRTKKEGYEFEIIPADSLSSVIDEIHEVSDSWLSLKKTREKSFSIGFFNKSYLSNFPCAVVKQEGKIVAFSNLMFTSLKKEFTIDLMRHDAKTPNGIMDFMFTNIMLWGKNEGYEYFNLGVAPLSGIKKSPAAPLWNRVASLVFGHGEMFYNFKGLAAYKRKFHPEWEPVHIVYSKPLSLPGILADIAKVSSGGIRGIISK